jgi:hypothetical protein
MDITLTHFVHQLLHSENISDRMDISRTIFKFLASPPEGYEEMQTKMQEKFIPRVKACVMHPASKERFVIADIATIYDNKYRALTALPFAA